MLTDVTGRDDDLSLRDIVILQKDNLQEVANILIIVDDSANTVNEVDDSLGHPVSRCCLSTEDGHSRSKLLAFLRCHCFDGKISVNDSKDVHLLTFIFVYTLDLDVEQSSRVDSHASRSLDVLGQSDLVGIFDLCPFLLELLVIDELLEFVEDAEILKITKTTSLAGNELRESGIGLVQPTSWSDSISDIGELVWAKNLYEILENSGLDKIGVKLGNTIDLMGTNNGQISHADHLRLGLLDDGNSAKQIPLFRELALNRLQKVQVDLVNNLEMSWKQVLEQWDRPLLQCFRKDRMVSISKL